MNVTESLPNIERAQWQLTKVLSPATSEEKAALGEDRTHDLQISPVVM